VCGLIAQYSGQQESHVDHLPATMRAMLSRRMTMRGFINYEFIEHYPHFLREVGGLVRSGAVKYREDIVDGLENAPAAFMGMLEGKNFGKMLVKVS
jgi:NADPH-dependent curcumin reductase CurA